MKVGRAYLGKQVKLTWRDPREAVIHELDHPFARGQGALATQVNYGLIDDITEGVVRIRHNEASHPQDRPNPSEWSVTWVPEELIVAVELPNDTPKNPGDTDAVH